MLVRQIGIDPDNITVAVLLTCFPSPESDSTGAIQYTLRWWIQFWDDVFAKDLFEHVMLQSKRGLVPLVQSPPT